MALQNTAKAVARMTFTAGAATYLCTGTLLNPTDGSFTAYFYSAYHCISTQQVANTLTTHWFYDRTACGTGVTSPSYVQRTGGATLLHANATSDALLLRLKTTPPAGAWFAGWDATQVTAGLCLHRHPPPGGRLEEGEPRHLGGDPAATPASCPNGSWIVANWTSGVTEGGSSGSGIFTAVGSPATDYKLRGGLWGGSSYCGAPPAEMNDCYSRFDLAYPSISGYLNPAVPVPGTFAFTTTGYAASEGLGSVVLSVVRQGGASGTVSVGWSTADGTAVSGADYGGGSGTLIWGAGDATAKTIVIPILADGTVEAAEAFTVTLGSPTGGTAIGSPSSATVTIADAGVFPPGGAMPAGWAQSPGAQFPWEVATDSAWEGTFSLKSGLPPNSSLHHNQRADVEVTVPLGTGDVTFARRVSSEAGADALRFYVDGVEQGAWSGEAAWALVSVPVSQGYRTLRWSYAKDGAFDAGADTAWIDAVTIPPTGLDPAGDFDGDSLPNGVEPAEWRNPFAKDNDLFSPTPASARLFAMQQYRDFLGREGDEAGISGWANAVASGAWSRPQVIDAFVGSAEFGGMVAPVVRLYFATFLRVPDYAGLVHNAGLVRSGALTLVQLAGFFATSPEFLATYGALDNPQFVTLLYQNVLGRAPDPAGPGRLGGAARGWLHARAGAARLLRERGVPGRPGAGGVRDDDVRRDAAPVARALRLRGLARVPRGRQPGDLDGRRLLRLGGVPRALPPVMPVLWPARKEALQEKGSDPFFSSKKGSDPFSCQRARIALREPRSTCPSTTRSPARRKITSHSARLQACSLMPLARSRRYMAARGSGTHGSHMTAMNPPGRTSLARVESRRSGRGKWCKAAKTAAQSWAASASGGSVASQATKARRSPRGSVTS